MVIHQLLVICDFKYGIYESQLQGIVTVHMFNTATHSYEEFTFIFSASVFAIIYFLECQLHRITLEHKVTASF